jgi:CNT family concentrative nucleoside transporter
MAWGLTKALRLSGAESLAVAGNIFVGQTESPLLVKAYIPTMTKSEIMLVMTAGMATMAGGVLAAYIQMLGNGDPFLTVEFAKHLLSASVMAAPGAVVLAKILVPQTEEINNKVEVSKEKLGKNALDAISNGTIEGLKLAANVAAMLLVFYALIAGVNYIFQYTGRLTIPRLAGIFAALVVGIASSYMLRHKISGHGKMSQSILLSIVTGLGIAVSFIFYFLFTLFVPVEAIGGMTAFVCWFTIATVLGFYIGLPSIKHNKLKKLHLTNGALALIFIGLFALMLSWKGTINNLNGIIAATTDGSYTGLSIEFVLGYAFAPLMWLIGICSEDATLVGQLMGQKLILTEFVAYGNLAELIKTGAFVEVKSVVMSTYILCGFANFASIGIQIGGIGSLALNQRPVLAKYGMHALLGGSLAALVSATMVGIILG